MVLRANPEVINPELFPFFLHSDLFMNRAVDISVGSLSPTINWGTLKHQEFMFPSKELQGQVIDLILATDKCIQSNFKVIKKIEALLERVNKNSFDYGYGSNSLPLPTNWTMLKVKDFSKVQAGSTPLRANKEFFENGTIPWLKTLDLNNGLIYETEENITELAIKKTSCKIKPINTVLVAMYGGFNQIGRTGLLKIPAATNQAVSAIEVDEKVVSPEYLFHVLSAKVEYWKKVAISSRKDPNITKNDVENFPVPIPPREKQNELVNLVNEVVKNHQDALSAMNNIRKLQRCIINQVF